jgi:streptomycin 6-kinase
MRIATCCSNTYMDVERRIMKPNKNFELNIRDIEVIESALRAKAGRRGMAIAQGDVSEKLKEEMHEIQELLGRIHHQKVWYSPKEFVPGG